MHSCITKSSIGVEKSKYNVGHVKFIVLYLCYTVKKFDQFRRARTFTSPIFVIFNFISPISIYATIAMEGYKLFAIYKVEYPLIEQYSPRNLTQSLVKADRINQTSAIA